MYSAFSLYPLISFAPSCNALRIYSSSFSSDACLHLLVWFCCSFWRTWIQFLLLLRLTTVYHQNKTISIISTFSTKWFTIKLYLSIETNRGIPPTSRDSFVLFKISTIQTMEQLCCRVADLYFILHRMGVVLMNKRFDFKDLMTFGLFILALLTFVFTFIR